MRSLRRLHRSGATMMLTRLLLAFALLFVDLLADLGAARSEPSPSGATHLMTGPGLAIVPPDAARLMPGGPQDDSADATWPPVAHAAPLPAQTIKGQYSPPASPYTKKAHLRPFPHGPPLV